MTDEVRRVIKDLGVAIEGRAKFPLAYPRPTVQEMAMMGGLLCVIKNNLGHGEFTEYVRTQCPFSYRTAHRYMTVHRLFSKSAMVADLDMEEK
jgi:hypothetical protein